MSSEEETDFYANDDSVPLPEEDELLATPFEGEHWTEVDALEQEVASAKEMLGIPPEQCLQEGIVELLGSPEKYWAARLKMYPETETSRRISNDSQS